MPRSNLVQYSVISNSIVDNARKLPSRDELILSSGRNELSEQGGKVLYVGRRASPREFVALSERYAKYGAQYDAFST